MSTFPTADRPVQDLNPPSSCVCNEYRMWMYVVKYGVVFCINAAVTGTLIEAQTITEPVDGLADDNSRDDPFLFWPEAHNIHF